MTTAAPAVTAVDGDNDASPSSVSARLRRWARGTLARDLAVSLFYLVLAFWVTHGVVLSPAGRALGLNPQDQALDEWFLAEAARVYTGDFGILTHNMNAPDGVNLLCNASLIMLGILFGPVTLTAGAHVTFALALTVNLAATSIGWYFFFSRVLKARRGAALIGAALAGFGPGMIAQSNSHLHITAAWLVPVMLWCVVRLWRGQRVVVTGLVLGALVSAHLFLGEENLFLTVITCVLFAVAYAAFRHRQAIRRAPHFVGGMLLATGVGVVLLAYPLKMQFAGPQSATSGVFAPQFFYADVASFWTLSPLSLGGKLWGIDVPDVAPRLATGASEFNTFFGLGLLIVVVVAVVWMWRNAIVRACAVAMVILTAMALGPDIVVNGEKTGLSGPFALFEGVPILDAALPTRFALPLLPLMATVLVLALDRALASEDRTIRTGVPVVALVALLPVLPAALPTVARPAVPRFITEGHWRDCVKPGGTLVPVPVPTPPAPDPLRWAAATTNAFAVPQGWFIGPYGGDGKAAVGIEARPTAKLLEDVAKTGVEPTIEPKHREEAKEDLAYWKAQCVVLADSHPQRDHLNRTAEALFGTPGRHVVDATIWKF